MKDYLKVWNYFIGACMSLFLVACASTGSPSGGPRDTAPPELVVEKSSKNFSTNYTPQKLELVFNEWIELKNQQREILISPPFFKAPQINSRGKKVTVEFPEEEPLREDATYTINFGKSIVDFTEGNAAEGFRFVFATGDKIDSLEFDGKILDARDGKPVKDILVLLYDVLEDSVVVYEKPFYYARTDDAGGFKFENLKNDTFKLLVLEDLNFNYVLDPELERLAFPDSTFILHDSLEYAPSLRLFKPEQSLRILNSSSQQPGLITTQFNKKGEEADYSVLYPDDFEPLIEFSKDTILLWFSEPRDSVGMIYGVDTLDFTIKPFDSLFYSKKVGLIDYNAASTILAPFDSLRVKFTAPIAAIDTSLIRLTNRPAPVLEKTPVDSLSQLMKDSLQNDTLIMVLDSISRDSSTLSLDSLDGRLNDNELDSIAPPSVLDSVALEQGTISTDSIGLDSILRQGDLLAGDSTSLLLDTATVEYDFRSSSLLRNLIINSDWKEKYEYRLEVLPGAIRDIYGRVNDTMILDFKTAALDEFGNIALNVTGLDSAEQYVILLKLNDEIVKTTILKDTTETKIEHKRLRVNTYSVEVIKDEDRNGAWTTGDYWKKRQPEELKEFPLEKLRENWDLEADIYWEEPETLGIDSTGVVQDSLGIGRDSTIRKVPQDVKKKGRPNRPKKGNGGNGIVPDPKGKND